MNGSLTDRRVVGINFITENNLRGLGTIRGANNSVFSTFKSGKSGVVTGGSAVDVADSGGFFDHKRSGG